MKWFIHDLKSLQFSLINDMLYFQHTARAEVSKVKMTFKGQSRSLVMSLSDKLYMTSYQCSIIAMSASRVEQNIGQYYYFL